ncbi:MAG: DoxX family protein [Bacteriovoracia bacterium]
MVKWIKKVIDKLGCLDTWVWLLIRISIGVLFARTGWGKLHNLDRVIGFFTNLGIPFPRIQAPFVATVEFVGGLCILFGIGIRFASIPLMVTMLVAIGTAKMGDVENPFDFVTLTEWIYFVLLAAFVVRGAGKASLDAWLGKKIK